MTNKLYFLREAIKDYESLDGSQRILVDKALKKILINPLPSSEGGYGKALSNLSDAKLAGLLKIKLKRSGLRIIYRLERNDEAILIIIIGERADEKVYKEAEKRIDKLDK